MTATNIKQHPRWSDINDAAREAHNSVKAIKHALESQVKALEAYLKERQLIREDFPLEELGIQGPYPRTPRQVRSSEFRGQGFIVDPRTFDPCKTEIDLIAKHLPELDLKLLQFWNYVKSVSSQLEQIDGAMFIVLQWSKPYEAAAFFTDYFTVNYSRARIHFYFKVVNFGDSVLEIYKEVSDKLESLKDDTSTSTNLLRGLAICLALSSRDISTHTPWMMIRLSKWHEVAVEICKEFPSKERMVCGMTQEVYPLTGELVNQADDLQKREEEDARAEAERLANDMPVGMDIMRHY